jgi:hypothetical protein
MAMKPKLRFFVMGILLFPSAVFFPVISGADDLILDGTFFPKQYIVQLSGTVMNETFSGVQAVLTVSPPPTYSNNPYMIIIQGFPKKNTRNSFYWNSEYTEMTSIANDITCDIKRTIVKPADVLFYFLSPVLLKPGIFRAQHEDERKRTAESVALPTPIHAQAGKMKLSIQSNSISGTIWMKGYDFIEKAYVQYSSRLHGNRSYNLKPRQQFKK